MSDGVAAEALTGGSSGDDEERDHRLSQDVDGGGGELELVWKGCRRGDLFGPFYIIYSAQYKTVIGKTVYKKCRALLIPVTEHRQLVGTIKGNLYFSHKGVSKVPHSCIKVLLTHKNIFVKFYKCY